MAVKIRLARAGAIVAVLGRRREEAEKMAAGALPKSSADSNAAYLKSLAERATGYYWGEPALHPYVRAIAAEAEAAGDDRLEQVARRFLR